MASHNNFKGRQQKYKDSSNMLQRNMKVIKSEELEENFRERIIDWTTFYRRNIHRFIEHYFGIKLHLYQILIIYLMNLCPLVVLICARASSKSFITALYACAVCVLYPNSKVLVTSKYKKQAGLLITEKVEKELMNMSLNLKREIKKISTNPNSIEVIFHNGSSFIASVAGEGARGLRSTVLITDEYRLVNREDLDSILIPTEIIRPTPYTKMDEYSHLIEEPREIYLSSAFYKSHWMWNHIKSTVKSMYEGDAILFATDLSVTLKHGIKTRKQLLRAKEQSDSITFDMEYNNFMVGGSENQFYSFELVSSAQKVKKAWYPKTLEEYGENKRNRFGDIKKITGEIRIVSMDIAMSESTDKIKNDLSVIKCIRALPSGTRYERQEVYTYAFEGVDIETQAIRARRIMEDFDADYFIFDARTYGTNMVDAMAKVLYDEKRDTEYVPLKVMNNETLKARCKNPNASPIMWAFIGTGDSNHEMHVSMKGALMDNRYKFLVSKVECEDVYLGDKKEYQKATADEKSRYELPYIYSDLTLHEMINLNKEFVQGGKIKLVEPSTGTKDKYVASAMGNLFIQNELEVKLTKKNNNSKASDYIHYRKPKTHY